MNNPIPESLSRINSLLLISIFFYKYIFKFLISLSNNASAVCGVELYNLFILLSRVFWKNFINFAKFDFFLFLSIIPFL